MNDLLSEKILAPALAKISYRWCASLIDYLLCYGLQQLIGFYFGGRQVLAEGEIGYSVSRLPAVAVIAVWFLLFGVMEGITGQTVGKAIFKIKVVKVTGDNASVGRCICRHLFDIVDMFPFGLLGIIVASNNDLRQRVGDLVAKTIVVQANNPNL